MEGVRARGRVVVATILVLLALVEPLASTEAGAASTPVAGCVPPFLALAASSPAEAYGPGVVIVLRVRATNVGSAPCALAVGASAPALTITGPTGRVVWRSCEVTGVPQPCPQFLVARVLTPGASLGAAARWDQLTGPSTRAAPGPYRVTARWGGAVATTTVRLVAASTRALRLGLADDGGWFSLVVGGRLTLRLAGGTPYRWTAPTATPAGPLGAIASAGGEAAAATLVARRPGVVRVSVIGTPVCYPQCLLPSRLFRVTVSVVAG